MDLRRESEILIGWVQAALVTVLGTLYLVAPSTSPADAVFRPVPWALGIYYGAFTMLRLVLAYRDRLSVALKIASVLVDVSMLMITIWSFHIQYGQPAAFYLKAPTLLYVFIFIVLRGFTKLAAALPPAELIDLLREYQRIAVPIIHQNNGSVVTYLGDGIMVTFGATRSTTTYCADAMRCSERLLEALAGWYKEREARDLPAPGVGIGVDAGTVTCGVIGDEGRLEYAIIGDPVNRAAKLQNQTKVEGMLGLASLACRDRAIEQGYVPEGPQPVHAGRAVAGVSGLVSLVALGESDVSCQDVSRPGD